jgi:uncharacterized cupredoxin-like copper-binding protein
MGKLLTLMAMLSATALIAAGCGGGSDNSSSNSSGSSGNNSNTTDTSSSTTTTSSAASGGGAGSNLALAADSGGALKFDKTQLTAKAGKVTIDFNNPSQTPHAVEVEGNGLKDKKTNTITGGGAKLSLGNLKPGKYEFYCPVPGHKQAGMKGTLTVS